MLAADLAADIMPFDVDIEPIAQCEVAMEAIDTAADNLANDATEITANDATEVFAYGEDAAQRIHELDLSDGSDGVFETIDAKHPEGIHTFEPPEDGTVDIVVATSFGDASTIVELRDSTGEMISATVTEGLDNFHTLRVDVDAGEAYQLTVGSDEGSEGSYQLTVGFSAADTAVAEASDDVIASADNDADETDCDSSAESERPAIDATELTEFNEIDAVDNQIDDQIDVAESTPTSLDVESTADGDVETEESGVATDESQSDPATDLSPVDSNLPEKDPMEMGPTVDTAIDLHANQVGEKSTELSLATGKADMFGSLESSGDVDTFRFTPDFDGSMDLLLADVSPESDLDLNVSVYDNKGQSILDGATNEFVKLSFGVEADSQYYVSLSADPGQTGDYAMVANFNLAPEPADDHADGIGNDATALVFNNDSWTATGSLETGVDQDAFRLTADCSQPLKLSLNADSQSHQSVAQISVFDDRGDLLVQGNTNDGVDLVFDAVQGIEYQILVDSINDVALTYELTAKPLTDPITEGEDSVLATTIGSCNESLAGCGNESDPIDRIFSEIGEARPQLNFSFDSMMNELEAESSSLLKFARRI